MFLSGRVFINLNFKIMSFWKKVFGFAGEKERLQLQFFAHNIPSVDLPKTAKVSDLLTINLVQREHILSKMGAQSHFKVALLNKDNHENFLLKIPQNINKSYLPTTFLPTTQSIALHLSLHPNTEVSFTHSNGNDRINILWLLKTMTIKIKDLK
jgi:hypothetical protein